MQSVAKFCTAPHFVTHSCLVLMPIFLVLAFTTTMCTCTMCVTIFGGVTTQAVTCIIVWPFVVWFVEIFQRLFLLCHLLIHFSMKSFIIISMLFELLDVPEEKELNATLGGPLVTGTSWIE